MRQRLIAAFVGLAVVAVALFAVPRSFTVSHLIRSQEQQRVDDTATLVAHLLDLNKAPVTTAFLDSINADYEWIVVRFAKTAIGTAGAARGAAPDDLTATRSLSGGGSVTVGLSEPVVSSAVSDAVVPLILLGIAIVVLAGFAGYLLALRFAKPLQDLAEAAEGLGLGDLEPRLPHYKMPELRAIGSALTSSGAQIAATLKHERKLAVHASHELRTPIAALRLELEDLAMWRETPPSVADQLQQATSELDRLSTAVGDLLELSRERRAQNEIDVDFEDLVAEALGHPQDRRVVHIRGGKVPMRVEPVATTKVIQELIQAMLAQGAPQVAVSVLQHQSRAEISFQPASRESMHVVPPATAELASAIGGLIAHEGPGLVLRLPLHEQRSQHPKVH